LGKDPIDPEDDPTLNKKYDSHPVDAGNCLNLPFFTAVSRGRILLGRVSRPWKMTDDNVSEHVDFAKSGTP
jgi:hypothetical protein